MGSDEDAAMGFMRGGSRAPADRRSCGPAAARPVAGLLRKVVSRALMPGAGAPPCKETAAAVGGAAVGGAGLNGTTAACAVDILLVVALAPVLLAAAADENAPASRCGMSSVAAAGEGVLNVMVGGPAGTTG